MTHCPLPGHIERTASCAVSRRGRDGRWRWHCFGCGAGGDAIDLLRLRDGLSYAQAREATGEGTDSDGRYKPQWRGSQDASRASPCWIVVCDACQVERTDLDRASSRGWELASDMSAGVGPDCLERAARRRLGLAPLSGSVTVGIGTAPEGLDPFDSVRLRGVAALLLHAGRLPYGQLRPEALLVPGIDRPATERTSLSSE